MADKGMNHKREIVGIFYLAAALFLAAAFYLGDIIDPVGMIFRYAGLGLFGIAAYAIPAILFYMALDYFLERESVITRKRFIYVTILLISISALIHVFAIPVDKFKDSISPKGTDRGAFQALIHLWNTGISGIKIEGETSNFTGGILGGGLAFALESVANKAGAVIILISIFISEIVLIFNVSFSHAIRTTKEKVDTALRNKAESINENSRRKASEFDMVVGEENKRKAAEKKENGKKTGLFGIPGFLKDDDKEKKPENEIPIRETGTIQQDMGSFGDGEYSNGENENDSMDDPNIDLPAGIKRVDGGGHTNAAKDDYSVRKIIVPHQDTNDSTHDKQLEGSEADAYPERPFILPSIELLNTESFTAAKNDLFTIQAVGKKLETTLASFGIAAKVMNITNGPVITRFELAPGPGVKISKIVSLADDIALNLAATGVRIEAPIPGKSAIGIEVPNKEITPVTLRRLIESPEFKNTSSVLACVLGRDIPGNPVICDLAKMPHLLIAGATGSGKSVCINSILISILFKAKPDEVKFLMIDPKVVELSAYNGIPHLLAPVVTNPKKAANTLNWAVNEMTKRYALFAEQQVREIQSYNASSTSGGYEKLPLILIVIDELADLMATCPTEVEDAIARLTAMARAAGIHLIIATQRPSVDVITGVIKANIPSRVAFAVSSQVDSRTIIDGGGAEKLLGKGDMLYFPLGASKPIRTQGSFVTDKEVERITTFLKKQNTSGYDKDTSAAINTASNSTMSSDNDNEEDTQEDDLLVNAVTIIVEAGYASISLLQRRMNVGYPRAARLIDRMQEKGYVGPFEGSKPRKVLITPQQWAEYRAKEGE